MNYYIILLLWQIQTQIQIVALLHTLNKYATFASIDSQFAAY